MTKRKKFGISKTLSDSLSHTVKVASRNIGALRHEIVPIKLIELDPLNPRNLIIQMNDVINGIDSNDEFYEKKKRELEDLESLKNSIVSQGVLNPVWVYKHNTNYRLIMGERRVLASILAGNAEIQAKILESRPIDTDLRLLQWIENLERSDLTLWERIVNLKLIVEAKHKDDPKIKINATFIKNLLGCSLPHAMNYFAVIFCSKKLMHAIEIGKINNLEKAALLANITDGDTFNEVFELCITGSSLRNLQQVIRAKKLNPPAVKVLRNKSTEVIVPKTINLGSCKDPKVIREIVEVLLKQPSFLIHADHFDKIDWSNHSIVSRAFKSFIAKLERCA
jgi:ParB family chromosome partitioning protein